MVRFGISTWSIHRALERGSIRLLDVPAQLRAHGLTDLQICHFHIASRDEADLAALREQIDANGVTLDALLLDFGDISHPTTGDADAAELATWLPTAARLGARLVRISAGSQKPTDEALARSAAHLDRLSSAAAALGVRVVTENWHDMVPSPHEALRLIALTRSHVPLCLDFGNWSGAGKYAELEMIAPHAVTVHAKCAFAADGVPDTVDFERCLNILRAAGYAGTVALIYDSASDDEWKHIDEELAIARRVLG